ncbi:hypothetical protein [Cellulosimicrobium cellulans]|uniref:hypothetical protein n=1 Tax=Cellulosimicrobium cellulans TaxID=1710 RepID=UPI00240567AC|nr:hypothetical protein [Cellulosimicrobium cellulans]MDF9874816.1 hypothetical protein [Cellulosimicrobium cellulans]
MTNALGAVGAGTWPDWIAALGTSLAFLVAALAYGRDVSWRRQAQARLVYAKISHLEFHDAGAVVPMLAHGAGIGNGDARLAIAGGPGSQSNYVALEPFAVVTVEIHNGSEELIGPVHVQALNTGMGEGWPFSVPAGMVEPHSSTVVELTCTNRHYPGQPGVGVIIAFRDATSRWWYRQGIEPIERVHVDPESILFGANERRQAAANARLLGMTPSPEPPVTLRIRARRLVRRLRGRRAIP